ncbi:HAD-IA family hydrolase [Streptomyces sp. NBC_00287]|uniref:HAD family hydrolase n=1 Tax=Streptomyces sp. NBC_00287 TaxID=2975702 RepID=UPI002E2ABBAF|nr:HAD-IA family hydrolase [Streptomyces sp. NBC_00287]
MSALHPPSPIHTRDLDSDTEAQRVLLLDLDGVLMDTRPVMEEAWRAVQATHGIHVPFKAYQQCLGRPFGDIMDRLSIRDTNRVHTTYSQAAKDASHLARPFDGMSETLHVCVAAGWLLGVVTSKPLDRAVPLLAQLGCPFGTVRAPGGPGRGKPAPDPILLALVDLAADPADAVYVGDMEVDQEAARRAGVAYVHAGWGYGAPGCPAPETAHSPLGLLPLLGVRTPPAPFIEGGLL